MAGPSHVVASAADREVDCYLPQGNEILSLRITHRTSDIRLDNQDAYSEDMKLVATTKPLQDLSLISLKELEVACVAHDCYAQLRTIEEAKSINGITTIVVDQEGDVVIFCTYNFTDSLNPDLDDILPIGTMFNLKEPYMNKSDKYGCYLRCDCPSDMYVMHEGRKEFEAHLMKWGAHEFVLDLVRSRPLPTDVPSWLERGQLFQVKGRFKQATRCYHNAYELLEDMVRLGQVSETERVDLKKRVELKLAYAYYKRGYYENAMEYLPDPVRSRGEVLRNPDMCRIGIKCCYRMKNYKAASEYVKYWRPPSEEHLQQERLSSKVMQRLQEEKTGENYNMYVLFNQEYGDEREDKRPITVANFFGDVDVVERENRGNCVVAKRDLEPGTLVMVSEALAFSENPPAGTNPTDGTKGWRHVITQLAQKALKNLKDREIIYSLGKVNSAFPPPPDYFCDYKFKVQPIVDVKNLKTIVTNCIFGTYVNKKDSDFYCELKGGVGVFDQPSYFNHSCLPNVSVHNFGKNMFLRTIQFVSQGEELFLPYVSYQVPYDDRKETCKLRNFTCTCRLCELENKVDMSVRQKRKEILLKYTELSKQEDSIDTPTIIARIKTIIRELEETYKINKHLSQNPQFPERLVTSKLYSSLASAYRKQMYERNWERYDHIECNKRVLLYHGLNYETLVSDINNDSINIPRNCLLDKFVFESIVDFINIYGHLKNQPDQRRWFDILVRLEKIYSGGDDDVLKPRYGVDEESF